MRRQWLTVNDRSQASRLQNASITLSKRGQSAVNNTNLLSGPRPDVIAADANSSAFTRPA